MHAVSLSILLFRLQIKLNLQLVFVAFKAFKFYNLIMESELATFMAKCRCCLENVKGDTYVKITKLIEERFLEFTSTSVSLNYLKRLE